MNKAIRISILSILLISLLSVFSFASYNSSYTFYYDDREITIEGANLNEEDAQALADYIVLGITPAGLIDPGNSTNSNLLCILFGHSTETYYACETIHNVYTTSPKCVENNYEVEVCTRSNCDYIVKTLLYSIRISTCHG